MKKLVTIILALMLTAAAATGCADNSAKDTDRDGKIETELENGGAPDGKDEEDDAENPDGGEDEEDKDGEEYGGENADADKDIEDEQPEVPELPAHGDKPEQKPSQDNSNSNKPANKPSADVPSVIVPEIPAEVPSVPTEPEVPAETPAEPEAPVETPDSSETPAETPSETDGISSKTAEEIIGLILEQNAPLFMYGTMQIDLTDEYSFNRYTGLSSAENVLDAAVCEPMIGSQAYSMVVVKLADGTDVQATAETMKSNINPRKWICVEADDIKVSGCGNVVMFIMISSDFAEDVTASSATEAFKTVCGGALDFEL